MKSIDKRSKLAKKSSLVVQDFRPGCGRHAQEREGKKLRKRKLVDSFETSKKLPKEMPSRYARQPIASVTLRLGVFGSTSVQVSSVRERVMKAMQTYRGSWNELFLRKFASTGHKKTTWRIDREVWKILQMDGIYVHRIKEYMGHVPGVEIGDKFYHRTEMAIVDLHRPLRAGIDCMKQKGKILATSIVASRETDNMNKADELVYMGEGGLSNQVNKDQKLVRGNLAMKNSIEMQNPVRVIRKVTASMADNELITCPSEIYVYDGLYLVQTCHENRTKHGHVVFVFKLVRIYGQPYIARYRG